MLKYVDIMKIALVRPRKISGTFEKILIQEPINLAGLAAFLNNNGFRTVIWDFEVEPYSEQILSDKIKENNIELVGITSMTPTINNAHELAQAVKKTDAKIVTVAGGPHVSAIPDQSLDEFPFFDYLVLREGEIPLLSLCEHIKQGKSLGSISGIAYRKNGQNQINWPAEFIENLDRLPFADRRLLKRELYKDMYAAGIDVSGQKSTVVFTSRGCAQNCTFCAVHKTSGAKVRFRSAENVIKELKHCKMDLGYDHITFEDTNFTLNKDRFKTICNALKELKLTWDCQTKVSFVDKQMIDLMKECGCLKIAYGVESGSPKILKLINKNITIDQIKKAFRLTHNAGIVACGFFILGAHPEEDHDDIRQTEQLIRQIKPDVFQLGIICPYPGTKINQIMQDYGMIKKINWSDFNFMHASINYGTKYISADELKRYQKKIYTRYLLSLHFIKFLIKKLLMPKQILRTIKLSGLMFKYLVFEKSNN
jgi:radical SAM superfamily enzyme YgiQ (UPF0313 family)